MARGRLTTTEPPGEGAYRRRPSDRIRVVAAAVMLAVLAARPGSRFERDLSDAFGSLPAGLHALFTALYRAGAIWAIVVLVATAVAARRWRLARDIGLAGGLTWFTGRLMGLASTGGTFRLFDVVRRTTTPPFPLVRLAVIVAVLSVAGPYINRPARWTGRAVIAVLAPAALYLGTAAPNDLAGALVLGWGVAALVHAALGSPGGRPGTDQVEIALRDLGIDAHNVRLAPDQPPNETVMEADDADGPIRIRVIGRDEADTALLAKLWRYLYYRDSGAAFYLTRVHEVEHQAYCLLAAKAAGATVPDLLAAGVGGQSIAMEVERKVIGHVLDGADALPALWTEVGRLRARRVAHGALNATHVLLTPDGPVLTGFSHATVPADDTRLAADVAELLVATSLAAGSDAAIAASRAGVGDGALIAALPFLQPAALTRAGRAALGHRKDGRAHLDALRQAAARAVGTDAPPLARVERVERTSLLMAVGALLGVAALLGAIGSPAAVTRALGNASPGWVVAAFVLAFLTNIGYAVALMGASTRPLPLGATTELQVATSFSNLAIPLGGSGFQVRFLQKQGVDLASAVAAGGLLSTVAGIAVQLGILAVALPLSPRAVNVPFHGIAVAAAGLGVFLVVAGTLVAVVPLLRRRLLVPVEHGAGAIVDALRSPSRLVMLVSGTVATTVLGTLSLLACLEAFGHSVSLWTLLAVQISVSTVASLIPVPGGGTAVGSVGLAGALGLFGVPRDAAVAAVLTSQVVGSYLPAIPGWFATQDLIRRDLL